MVELINPGTTKEIVGDDNIRAQKFARSIEQLQYEYDCVIVPVVQIVGNKINPGWQIGVLPRDAGRKQTTDNPQQEDSRKIRQFPPRPNVGNPGMNSTPKEYNDSTTPDVVGPDSDKERA
jgi:hypothetical protein